MTQPHAKSRKPIAAGPALIVFGLSEDGKPRAGTFQKNEIEAATKASAALSLAVLKVSNDKAADLAAKLLPGRVNANGQGFVPFIRGALYEQLLELAKAQGVKTSDALTSPKQKLASSATADSNSADSEHRLPKSWDDIGVGDLVLIQDTDPQDGWWKAIVVQKKGEMYTLRWQQNPTRRAAIKHKYNLALLWSGDDSAVKPLGIKEPGPMYPANWQAIGLNQLVLAQEDGPMEQFWEATPIEANGDSFTMRWRDYPNLPTIVRPRLSLALLYPNPGNAAAKTTVAA
jgi:hypothetical protein